MPAINPPTDKNIVIFGKEIDAIPSKIVLARLCAVNLEAHFLKSRRDVFAYPVDIIHLFVFDVKRFYQKTPHPKMSAEKINILFK